MDPTITTLRLRLTLLTTSKPGTQDLAWYHELKSNEHASWWSIGGHSSSIQEASLRLQKFVPAKPGSERKYNIAYAVHRSLSPGNTSSTPSAFPDPTTEFIGVISLRSVTPSDFALPPDLVIPFTDDMLTVELGYAFLPKAWGHGYASEATTAFLETAKERSGFWEPFEKVWVRVVVDEKNEASQKVMRKVGGKVGLGFRGKYEWRGEAVWLAGKLRTDNTVLVYGGWLLGQGG